MIHYWQHQFPLSGILCDMPKVTIQEGGLYGDWKPDQEMSVTALETKDVTCPQCLQILLEQSKEQIRDAFQVMGMMGHQIHLAKQLALSRVLRLVRGHAEEQLNEEDGLVDLSSKELGFLFAPKQSVIKAASEPYKPKPGTLYGLPVVLPDA